MGDSALARAHVCKTHGPVTPVLVGSREKCPECGVFLKKNPTGAALAAMTPRGENLDEMFRRLELREMVTVARRRITGPEWAREEDNVDYRTTLRMLELIEGRAMDLPLPELERVVPNALARACEVAGLPNLHDGIRFLKSQESTLTVKVEKLQSQAEAREARLAAAQNAYDELQRKLAGVQTRTGLGTEAILHRLTIFETVQHMNAEVGQDNARLMQANAQLSARRDRLAREVQDFEGRLKRLEDACRSPSDELLDVLAPEDFVLLTVKWKVRHQAAPPPPPDPASRRVASWIRALMGGETVVFDVPRLGPDGGRLRGPDGAIVFDKLGAVISREDRERLQRLIREGCRGAEGAQHALLRIFSEKRVGDSWPAATGNPDDDRRTRDAAKHRLEAVNEFLGVISDILAGKRGRFAMLPPREVGNWITAPLVEVQSKVDDAISEALMALMEYWRDEIASDRQKLGVGVASSAPASASG